MQLRDLTIIDSHFCRQMTAVYCCCHDLHQVLPSATWLMRWCGVQHIAHVHAAIRSALDAFASEAASLAASDSLKPAALAALVERLRFLRAVCSYHSASEDDVLFPAVRYDARKETSEGGIAGSTLTSSMPSPGVPCTPQAVNQRRQNHFVLELWYRLAVPILQRNAGTDRTPLVLLAGCSALSMRQLTAWRLRRTTSMRARCWRTSAASSVMCAPP